jgi:mannosyl-3-phosphoglycerate phosphatase family protein
MRQRRQPLIVFTDLDGCLLDSRSYDCDAARPAVAALLDAGHPVVLCSGKTRSEMSLIHRSLGLNAPFIVENGGAIVFPPGSFPGRVPGAQRSDDAQILALGAPRSMLISALRAIAAESGAKVRGFADMALDDVMALTGLPGGMARLALEREYDEPFTLEGGEDALAAFRSGASRRSLEITHGGRFHHLTGGSDKGLAVRALLACYQRAGRRFASVGLGDAATDLSLLRAVDRPIVVPRSDGAIDVILAARLPDAERAPRPGPAGWADAMTAVMEGRTLPPVAR